MAISVPLYTVDDLQHFPEDGNRYELLDGVLLYTAKRKRRVLRDTIRWRIAGTEVAIDLRAVFAGLR